MMKRTGSAMVVAATFFLLLSGPGCVMEDREVEVVLTGETCVEFKENHESEQYTTPVMVDYASEIDAILEDNDLEKSDIAEAKVMSAIYSVTAFDHGHDWSISGFITVQRAGEGAAETIMDYTDQSLLAAQASPVIAPLNEDGIQIVNQALQDYLEGGEPMLWFEVNNGSVTPDPSASDPLVFTWEACIKVHALYREEVEVPDPL